MKKLGGGKYRHRLRVEKRDEDAVSEMNEPIESWDLYCERWAEVLPSNGREFAGGDKVASDVTHNVRMRYDSTTAAITPKMRLRSGDRIYNITHATEDGHAKEMLLMVREVTT